MYLSKAWTGNAIVRTGGTGRWARTFLLSVSVVLTLSCSTPHSEDLYLLQQLPLPEGAYGVEKVQVGSSRKNQQLLFNLKRSYPTADAVSLYSTYFAREGWIRCRSPGDQWNWFLDKTSRSDRVVHRITGFWMRPDRRAIALVAGQYFSAATATSGQPDNAVQVWTVLMQDDVTGLDEAKRLLYDCS